MAQLQKSIAFGRLRHAYLITGPDSIGKNTLAHAFAMALNCTHPNEAQRPCMECRSCRLIISGNHPDMLYAEQDASTGNLPIDAIRAVMRRLAMKPFEARYRIAIFEHFDEAQPRAQDALLKTLEEPPPAAVLILMAQSAEALLPTIISRSQIINLRPVALPLVRDVLIERYGAEPEQAEWLARLSAGRIGWAIARWTIRPCWTTAGTGAGPAGRLSWDAAGPGALIWRRNWAKSKLDLRPVLELWQTYWRDLLLLTRHSEVPPANSDRLLRLQQFAIHFSADEVLQALRATRSLSTSFATTSTCGWRWRSCSSIIPAWSIDPWGDLLPGEKLSSLPFRNGIVAYHASK